MSATSTTITPYAAFASTNATTATFTAFTTATITTSTVAATVAPAPNGLLVCMVVVHLKSRVLLATLPLGQLPALSEGV